MPVFEALHSAFISSDEEGDVLRTRPLEWRSEEVSIFFFKIWTLTIEKVCPTSKECNVLTEGSALQVPETIMKFLSHCSGPLNCSSFRFSMLVTVELQYIFKSKSAKTLFQDLFQNKYGT